jgi:hypothetical protein
VGEWGSVVFETGFVSLNEEFGGRGALALSLGVEVPVNVVGGCSLLFGTMGVSFVMGAAAVLSALSQRSISDVCGVEVVDFER